ncbi:MAG TPA: CrcB family protein [Acidimicrobiales bacterium]|nr:CrcB family protein [Acidimicrobiales bacterium]
MAPSLRRRPGPSSFLGACTTFSTFAVATVRMAGDGSPGAAALNVAVTLVSTVGLAGAGDAL